jgi:hypothetical protein
VLLLTVQLVSDRMAAEPLVMPPPAPPPKTKPVETAELPLTVQWDSVAVPPL